MLIALDTNILGNALGYCEPLIQDQTINFLKKIPTPSIIIPAQTLLELGFFLKRKYQKNPTEVGLALTKWKQIYQVANSTANALQDTIQIITRHQIQIFDAFILSVASENNCTILLSQDMQDGFKWSNTTIVNPYSDTPNPLFAVFLSTLKN
ncbi:MAG: PIN domain-containing protein [Holophagaceae bacterium]|nr:PIN domain-containing protein [Holophagaceae bacterium]